MKDRLEALKHSVSRNSFAKAFDYVRFLYFHSVVSLLKYNNLSCTVSVCAVVVGTIVTDLEAKLETDNFFIETL